VVSFKLVEFVFLMAPSFQSYFCFLYHVQSISSDPGGAELTFSRIREIDECSMDAMDEYAQLFQRRGALAELSTLSADLLDLDDKRPEAWVCLALYHQAQNDNEKALGTCPTPAIYCRLFDHMNMLCLTRFHLCFCVQRSWRKPLH
jgi:hypothetical protein